MSIRPSPTCAGAETALGRSPLCELRNKAMACCIFVNHRCFGNSIPVYTRANAIRDRLHPALSLPTAIATLSGQGPHRKGWQG